MTTIALGDLHCPFQSNKELGVAYKVIEDLQPDKIILMGDLVDFYAISSFSRNPIRVLQLQDELNAAKEILGIIDSLSNAEIVYLMGNHEDRLQRYLMLHPEIYNLDSLKLEYLLGLDELNIKIKTEVKEGDLIYTHGKYVSKHSAYSVKRELEARAYQISVLMGHTHRQGMFSITGYKNTVDGYEIGCLCKDQEYMTNPDWQRGFAVITDGFVELIKIRKNKTIFRGKLYKG